MGYIAVRLQAPIANNSKQPLQTPIAPTANSQNTYPQALESIVNKLFKHVCNIAKHYKRVKQTLNPLQTRQILWVIANELPN